MKKFVIAATAIAAFGFVNAASAADMPVKAVAAPVAVPYSWSGWYVGVNAGYAWGRASTATVSAGPGFAGPAAAAIYSAIASPNFDTNGFTGGVQAGYNYHMNNWLLGVEADFGAFALKGSTNTTGTPLGSSTLFSNTEVKTDWLFTLRPRLGITAGQWLVYATGGLAVTNFKYSQFNFFTPCGGPGGTCIESVSTTKTKAGWTAGAGVEAALWGRWTVKGEYLYADFGSIHTTGCDNAVCSTFTHSAKLTASIARLGLNYRF